MSSETQVGRVSSETAASKSAVEEEVCKESHAAGSKACGGLLGDERAQ